jgi:hypothetical protein
MNLPVKKTAKLETVSVAEIVEAQAKDLINTSEGLELLEKLLKETFPQPKIRDYIRDLCEAEDIKMSKMGPYKTPNWRARKDGLDKVLDLLNFKRVVDMTGQRVPTKVVFNTIIVGSNAKEQRVKVADGVPREPVKKK